MRKSALVLALLVGTAVLATAASAQVICAKTNNKGRTKFKLRDTCKSNETIANNLAGVPDDAVSAADLPAPPDQLATVAQIPVVRETEIHHTSHAGNQSGSITQLIDLDDLGGESYSFATTAASTDLVIIFEAECGYSSEFPDLWIDLQLSLDGVVLPPTDAVAGNDAFCASPGSFTFGYRRSSVTSVVEDVPAGDHSIQVTVGVGTGGPVWQIGELSLVVIAHED